MVKNVYDTIIKDLSHEKILLTKKIAIIISKIQ